MNKLFIDTASNQEIIVRLTIDTKVFEEKVAIQNNRTQVVLPTIEKLLKENNILVKNLDAVEVNTGPGSFTGLRVGAAIANALGYALQIPVNKILFKESGKVVEPHYS